MGQFRLLALAALLALSGCVTVDRLTLGQPYMTDAGDAVIVEIELQKPRKYRWSSVAVTARFGFRPGKPDDDALATPHVLALDPIPPFQRDRRLYRGVIALTACSGRVTATVVARATVPGAGTRPRPEVKAASLSLARSEISPSPSGKACHD